MQISSNITRRGCRAYTLAEVMVAVGIFIGMFLALYVGFAASFSIIQNARENLRATQILMQRMETVRLYTWTQLNSASYVKPTFTDSYAPLGVTYHGTIQVSVPTQLGNVAYATNMRTVRVAVTWTNAAGGNQFEHRREMVTHVSRFGLQNYVFGVPSTQ